MGKETRLFKSEERQNRADAAAFLHQLADKIDAGQVVLRQGQDELVLQIPNNVILEVQVEDEDKKKKDQIEIRNKADGTVFQLEKMMRDNDAKIPDDLKKSVNEKIGALKDLLKDEKADSEAIKKATEELEQEAQKIGAEIYKNVPQEDQSDDVKVTDNNKEGEDDVVDGEVVDDGDEEK